MAYLTFAIVTLFFVLNVPRILLGTYEVTNTWKILRCVENESKYISPLSFYVWDTVSRLLMVVNSSINFLIYCTGSEQFKKEFMDLFVPNCFTCLRNYFTPAKQEPAQMEMKSKSLGKWVSGRNCADKTLVFHFKSLLVKDILFITTRRGFPYAVLFFSFRKSCKKA